jgi:hypothetical protein
MSQTRCRRYKLLAASYESPPFAGPIHSPFSITLPADSEVCKLFENPSFGKQDDYLPYEPEIPLGMFRESYLESVGLGKPEEKDESGQKDKPTDADDITLVESLGPALLETLHEAGYATVGEVILAGEEKLTEISGIGKATADKIIAACQTYLGG